MEGVDAVESTRVDETHEQIADVSPMLGLEEQRILMNMVEDIRNVIQSFPERAETGQRPSVST
jgi:hypothetical protein